MIQLKKEIVFGGQGNQYGTAIDIKDNTVFLSSYRYDVTNNQAGAATFSFPLSGSTPSWSTAWPSIPSNKASGTEYFNGVTAGKEGIYFAGSSYTQTTDGVGDKEAKGIAANTTFLALTRYRIVEALEPGVNKALTKTFASITALIIFLLLP